MHAEAAVFARNRIIPPIPDILRIYLQKGSTDMIMDRISLILVIIGALNWGSIGLFKFDLVSWICGGQDSLWARLIYTVVALAGIWCISLLFRSKERQADMD